MVTFDHKSKSSFQKFSDHFTKNKLEAVFEKGRSQDFSDVISRSNTDKVNVNVNVDDDDDDDTDNDDDDTDDSDADVEMMMIDHSG